MKRTERNLPDFCIERNSIVKTKILSRLWDLGKVNPINVLDVGCGNADWLIPLLNNVPSINYFGIEPSNSQVLTARANLPKHAHQIFQGRGEDLSFVFDFQFDVVVTRAVFEHVYKRARFIHSLSKALLPRGTLLFSYGTNHFKEGSTTDARNFVSKILAILGYDRYYAAPVNKTQLKSSMVTNGFNILDEKSYSLDDLKMAHKLIPDDQISKNLLLDWLSLEDEININSSDSEMLEKLTNEMFFEARKLEYSTK